jgi:MULE transposase domain
MFQENFASTPDGANDSTILVFCTVPFFTAFCAVKTIFIDGTFNIAPTGFSRYLSLLSTQGTYGRFIPAMHCLLTGCTEDFYGRLFALIKSKAAELQIEIQWEIVVADYDPILVNAFRVCFPLVEMQGCHFHFIAAVYKVAYSLLKVRESFLPYLTILLLPPSS